MDRLRVDRRCKDDGRTALMDGRIDMLLAALEGVLSGGAKVIDDV